MSIVLNAEMRDDMGKGASRRLSHSNKIPAIVYCAGKHTENLILEHKDVQYHLQKEAYNNKVIELNVAGKKK